MSLKNTIALAVAATLGGSLTVVANAYADKGSNTGPFGFKPIAQSADSAAWNPAAPWVLPRGFEQSVVSDESDLNVYTEVTYIDDSSGVTLVGQHLDGVVHDHPEVLDARSVRFQQAVSDTGFVHLDAEEVLVRPCRRHLDERVAVAEADF